MHIHNFLVDYRNMMNISQEDYEYEDEIFSNECIDNGILGEVITNDSERPSGRPSDDEIVSRRNGLLLRDHLKLLLANHTW